MAYIRTADTEMAYVITAYIDTAYVVTADIGMVHTVIQLRTIWTQSTQLRPCMATALSICGPM